MMGSRQPLYFFDLDGSDKDDNCADEEGTRLPNDDAAFEHANRIMKELKEAGSYGGLDWHMVVKDENKDIVFCIPFRSPVSTKIVKGVASILPFIRPRSDFDDDVARIMGEAFDAACNEFDDPDTQEFIAKQIVAAARLGERDVERLRDVALAALGRRPVR
jgi:hypothetical protein